MIGGLCDKNFMAPFIFEGHCNTTVFELYVEHMLVPKLKIGMVVVIGNARFHKSTRIKTLIESVGAKFIYLPPYSSDLNPIEHYWYKIKKTIRKMMRDTKMVLDEAMGSTLKNMSIF